MSVLARKLATNSVWCWSGIAAFCVLLPDISDGGAEMAGDLETDFELVAQRSLCAHQTFLARNFHQRPAFAREGLTARPLISAIFHQEAEPMDMNAVVWFEIYVKICLALRRSTRVYSVSS
jgi:hypothetical protein